MVCFCLKQKNHAEFHLFTAQGATNGVPVDHLNEARCRLVARLIEARGFDGAAKDQPPHGDL